MEEKAVLAVRPVPVLSRPGRIHVHRQAGRTKVVAEQPGEAGDPSSIPDPDGDANGTGIVVALHRASRTAPFEITSKIDRSCASHRPLHPLPIPIVNKTRRGSPTHPHQPVLGVERAGLRATLGGLADLVAVAIIRIGRAAKARGCMRNAPRPRRAAHAGIVAQGRPFFADQIASGGGEGVGERPV